MLTLDELHYVVDRLEHQIDPSFLTRELIDLAQHSAARHLINDIAKCVGVRMWVTHRNEINMSGETEEHKFVSVFGLQTDVETAMWLFELIDERIAQNTSEYANTHIFSTTPDGLIRFTSNQISIIRSQLSQIVDYCGTAKEAVIAPAFAQLNIKITRNKRVIDYAAYKIYQSLNIT